VDPPTRLITVSIFANFAGSVRLVDWVEARVDVQRVGGRMAFVNAYLHVGDRRVVRASAGFARADTGEALRPTTATSSPAIRSSD